MGNHIVAPSLLAADFGNIERDINMVNKSAAEWLHLDVMDGRFVPNISFGYPIIKAAKKVSTKTLDVHLMIEKPELHIEGMREAGADVITVHYEACVHLHRTLTKIRSLGAKAGVALNPHTSVSLLEDVLEEIDLVLIMSVNPGYGGQKFIYNSLAKIRKIKEMIVTRHTNTVIEVDGGVGLQNAQSLLDAGADVLVAGSSVFKSEDPTRTISQLKEIGVRELL